MSNKLFTAEQIRKLWNRHGTGTGMDIVGLTESLNHAVDAKVQLLIEACIDAAIHARETGADGDPWYQMLTRALEQHGYDEYGDPIAKQGSEP